MTTLQTAGEAAGLFDNDILALAKVGLPPAEAIIELKQRFPGAFRDVFDARTATKADREAWLARYRSEQISKRYAAETEDAITRAEARLARRKS